MKQLRLLFMLLLCAVVNGVWGDDVTIDFSDNTTYTASKSGVNGGGSSSPVLVSNGDISFAADNGYIDTSSSHVRVYSTNGGTMTFSTSNGKMSKIEITCTANDANSNGPGKISSTIQVGGGSYSYSGKVGTWSNNSGSSTVTLKANAQVRITQIVVTYTPTSSYTITALSNDNSLGTVSLSGTTITATPAENCRYAAPAYTVTEGTATVSQDGDEFIVTPSTDCTVRINFEAIPTHTLSYSVSPAGAGTVELSETTVYEGATATATASANAGYKFLNWSISGADAELSGTTDNPATITMGISNAVVTANFEAVITYEINYSVNGSIVKTVNVEKDETVDLSAPISGIPSGYVFTGWVVEANKIDTPTDADPSANYVTSATSTANITYYAVMAIKEENIYWQRMSISSVSEAGTYAIIGPGNKPFTGSISSGHGAEGSTEISFDSEGKATSVPEGTCELTLNVSGSGFTIYNESYGYLYAKAASAGNLAWHASESNYWYYNNTDANWEYNSNLARLRYNGTNGYPFRTYGSNLGDAIRFAKKVDASLYSAFCTTVPPHVIASYADGWTSYVTTDDVEFPEALEAYVITSTNAGILREKITQAPARTPLVIHATEGAKTYNLQPLNSAPAAPAVNELKASDGSITIDDSNYKKIYVLTVVDDEAGFGPLAKGRTLAAGKVYLEFDTAQAKDFIGFFDTTSIEDVNLQPSTLDPRPSTMYNLSGQRVSESYKGIVIINGKKVIRK